MPFETETAHLLDRLARVQGRHRRRLIALAGPPASGKSTLAETLAETLPNACVVPMDGFHLDNRILAAQGLTGRKGAPDTFDVAGFHHLLQRLQRDDDVFYPIFDRARDCAIAGAGLVTTGIETVVVEGNYLLLDAPMWRDLADLWDFAVFLRVPEDLLQARLMQRWHDHGFSAQAAHDKIETNDMPNARTTAAQLMTPDLVLEARA